MMIQVVENHATENGGHWIELATEKKTVGIYLGESYTNVCVQNNSNKRRLMGGRVFHGENTLEQAKASYKDSSVKAMIETAQEILG